MAKETLPLNGLPKDQGTSPLTLKSIEDMSPDQVEQRADELGFRVTKQITFDPRGRKPSEDDPVIQISYIITCPRALPVLPRKKEHVEGVIDHVEALRKVLEKWEMESSAKHSQLIPTSIEVRPNSIDRNLVNAVFGRPFTVTAQNTLGESETLLTRRFRHSEDARIKAEDKIEHINKKRAGKKNG